MTQRLARLLHPAFLLALAVLLVNDHVLKDAFASPVTGKLSDVAGLVVLPVLLTTLLGIRSRQRVWAVHLTVGLAFAAVQFVPESTLWALGLTVRHTPDPTDLLALAVLPLGVRLSLADDRQLEARPVWAHAVGLVAVGAVLATSPVPPPAFIDHVPVLNAASPEEGFLTLEHRLDSLGFQPVLERPAFMSYSTWLTRPSSSPFLGRDSTRWRYAYAEQRQKYESERGADGGRESYRIMLSEKSCSQVADSTSGEMVLAAYWDERKQQISVFMWGWGALFPYDESSRVELQRTLSDCLVGPLREAAGMQRMVVK